MNHPNAHIDRFVEQLGRLAEGERLPRTAGRMMGVLMTCGAPMGIDELAARLKVSRASISTNSRLLQSLAIADLVSAPGSRRDYLQISGDPCSSLLTLGLHRMQSMRGAVRELRLALNGAAFGVPRARLKRMERFYDLAIEQAQSVLTLWRHKRVGHGDSVGANAAPLLLPRVSRQPTRRRAARGQRERVQSARAGERELE